MDTHTDGKDNKYVNVNNIRITLLEESAWHKGSKALRIQAYRNEKDNSLHNGAEIPIPSDKIALELIEAITTLVK